MATTIADKDTRAGLIIDSDETRLQLLDSFLVALEFGLVPQFCSALTRLDDCRFDCEGNRAYPPRRALLFKDFAPYSFTVLFQRWNPDDETWHKDYVGGLIYQGPTPDGGQRADGSFPALTCSLHDGSGWFLHT